MKPRHFLFLIFLAIIATACVDNPYDSESSATVEPISNIGFTYLQHDSAIFVAADLRASYSGSGFTEAYMVWYAKSGFSLTSPDSVLLYDTGVQGDILSEDGRYSREIALSSLNNSLVHGDTGTVYLKVMATYGTKIVTEIDSFSLGNAMPKIDSLIVPDTLIRPLTGIASDTLRVMVSDPDGLDDIKWVAYKSLKPDSTYANNGNYIYLYDDGGEKNFWPDDSFELTSGDEVKDDGTYAHVIFYDSTTPTGNYTWTFQAQDWGDNFSSIVSRTVVVQ